MSSNITHCYGHNAFQLHGLPLPRPGHVLGLLGTNGTGKSTCLQILSGRIKPNLGDLDEPPDWFYSVRQSLGAELLAAKRPVEAEVVYWDDLADHPKNGRSLFGLSQALRAQGRDAEADEIQVQFNEAWARSDVSLTTSKF